MQGCDVAMEEGRFAVEGYKGMSLKAFFGVGADRRNIGIGGSSVTLFA